MGYGGDIGSMTATGGVRRVNTLGTMIIRVEASS